MSVNTPTLTGVQTKALGIHGSAARAGWREFVIIQTPTSRIAKASKTTVLKARCITNLITINFFSFF
jgi:hypothetical protein